MCGGASENRTQTFSVKCNICICFAADAHATTDRRAAPSIQHYICEVMRVGTTTTKLAAVVFTRVDDATPAKGNLYGGGGGGKPIIASASTSVCAPAVVVLVRSAVKLL